MTGKHDRSELHALATAISEEAHGRRAHRRQRALKHAELRRYEATHAPVKRRNRHRAIAGSVVVLFAVGLAGTGIEIYRGSHHHVPPAKSVTNVPGVALPDIRAGRQAAQDITSQGTFPNVFSCQAWYDSHQLVIAPGESPVGFHAGFIHACTNAASTLQGAG